MASLGIRKFQDLVGRTDLLRVCDTGNLKARSLNFSLILKNALHMRPGVNIIGGSQRQVCSSHIEYFWCRLCVLIW